MNLENIENHSHKQRSCKLFVVYVFQTRGLCENNNKFAEIWTKKSSRTYLECCRLGSTIVFLFVSPSFCARDVEVA